jgi:hypothetical protein
MPTFQPFAAGQKVTAGDLDLNLMIGALVFRAQRSTSQTITSGTQTPTNALSWDAIDYDRLGVWSAGNPTRWTSPIAGWWTFSGSVGLNGNATGTTRDALWFVNGATITAGRSRTFAETSISTDPITVEARTIPILLAVGDYVELVPAHNASGPIGSATGTQASYIAVNYSGPN